MNMEVELEKYVIRERTRHGKEVFYYRKKPAPRIRIKAVYGTIEFAEEVRAAAEGRSPRSEGRRIEKPVAGSLRDLIVRYYSSAEFKQLDSRTQRVRRLILDKLCVDGAEDGRSPMVRVRVRRWSRVTYVNTR